MAPTVFVSAASGTTGRLVARALGRRGVRVRGGVRAAWKARLLPEGVEPAVVDFDRPNAMERVLADVERLYLVTPCGPGMAAMTAALMAAARQAGVRHVVKLSMAGAETGGGPARPVRWHHDAEAAIRDSGIPWTFLRPVSLMQTFAERHGLAIRAQSHFYDPVGSRPVGHVDARDVARVAVRALTEGGHEGRTYTLTGPEPLSNPEAAAILSQVTGREVRYVEVGPSEFRTCLLCQGLEAEVVEGILECCAAMRDGRYAAVSCAVEAVTGRAARTFAEFARDHLPAFT